MPSSPSGGGATAHRHHRNPAEAWRRWRGERSKPIRVRRRSACAPSVQDIGRVTAAGGRAQTEAPLLLVPGPGQRASQRRNGEGRRCRPLEEARDNSWRNECERQQEPDVPLDLAFAPGKHGEAASPASGQLVDPAASLGNRHQQALATRRRHRRVVRGHMNDAFGSARQGAGPVDGDRGDVSPTRR